VSKTKRTNWHLKAYKQLVGYKSKRIKPVLLAGGCLLYQLEALPVPQDH